ncbi:MAG: GNAT family N-acetyltransferase [Chloroflexota bacterium]
MKLIHQVEIGEADFWEARQFLRWLLVRQDMRQAWHVARLDYARWHVRLNCEQNSSLEGFFQLWREADGRIVAALLSEGRGEAHFQVDPAIYSAELLEQMLAAAEARQSVALEDGHRRLDAFAHSLDPQLPGLLEQRGYRRLEQPEHLRRRALEGEILRCVPAPGYSVRPLGEAGELPARSWVSWKAFHPDAPDEAYEGWAWYHNIQRQPLYRRDLDWVAVAPGGELVGFTTIWYDDVTRSGYVEPVGVHPGHQRKGLGKAVMSAALLELQRLGATLAYVGSYSPGAHALYAAMGFTRFDLLTAYRREW